MKLTTGAAPAPTLSIAQAGGKITLQFTGTLQSATKVNGPYAAVAGATSPYVVPVSGGAAFFRSAQLPGALSAFNSECPAG